MRWISVTVLLGVVGAGQAPGQDSATVRGSVSDSASGRALQAAQILTAGAVVATTDTTGRFTLRLPAGRHDVAARLVGYQPSGHRLLLDAGDTLTVAFRLAGAQRLPTLTADAPAPATGWRSAFEARRQVEFGAFITSDMLKGQGHRPLSVALREHATGVRFHHYETETIALGRGGCPMSIWVDGLRVFAASANPLSGSGGMAPRARPKAGLSTSSAASDGPPNIEQWRIDEIAAIEVYAGPGRTPMQYQVTGSACGTILIWTRAGTR